MYMFFFSLFLFFCFSAKGAFLTMHVQCEFSVVITFAKDYSVKSRTCKNCEVHYPMKVNDVFLDLLGEITYL